MSFEYHHHDNANARHTHMRINLRHPLSTRAGWRYFRTDIISAAGIVATLAAYAALTGQWAALIGVPTLLVVAYASLVRAQRCWQLGLAIGVESGSVLTRIPDTEVVGYVLSNSSNLWDPHPLAVLQDRFIADAAQDGVTEAERFANGG